MAIVAVSTLYQSGSNQEIFNKIRGILIKIIIKLGNVIDYEIYEKDTSENETA